MLFPMLSENRNGALANHPGFVGDRFQRRNPIDFMMQPRQVEACNGPQLLRDRIGRNVEKPPALIALGS